MQRKHTAVIINNLYEIHIAASPCWTWHGLDFHVEDLQNNEEMQQSYQHNFYSDNDT